jgi:hypothetical protein
MDVLEECICIIDGKPVPEPRKSKAGKPVGA